MGVKKNGKKVGVKKWQKSGGKKVRVKKSGVKKKKNTSKTPILQTPKNQSNHHSIDLKKSKKSLEKKKCEIK